MCSHTRLLLYSGESFGIKELGNRWVTLQYGLARSLYCNKRRDGYDSFCIATDFIASEPFFVKTADAPIPLLRDPCQSLPGQPGPRLSQQGDTVFVVCLSCASPLPKKQQYIRITTGPIDLISLYAQNYSKIYAQAEQK